MTEQLGGFCLSVAIFCALIAWSRGDSPKSWLSETKDDLTRVGGFLYAIAVVPHRRNGDK
jgi:hypothetical protein